MRKTEKTTIGRLKDSITELVEKMGKGVTVIKKGDCLGYEDAERVRGVIGRFRFLYANLFSSEAHSVMIAIAADANLSCSPPTPLVDVHQTLISTYLRVVSRWIVRLLRPPSPSLLWSRYLNNHRTNSKFRGTQFRGNHVESTQAGEKRFKDIFTKAKCYDGVVDMAGD